jgi:hypothetical protein
MSVVGRTDAGLVDAARSDACRDPPCRVVRIYRSRGRSLGFTRLALLVGAPLLVATLLALADDLTSFRRRL